MRTRTRLVPLNKTIQKQRVSLFLYVALLGIEVPANQTLRIAVDVRHGVIVMVVPKISGCGELPLTQGKCPGTAVIDAVDRGDATNATLQAEQAALNY